MHFYAMWVESNQVGVIYGCADVLENGQDGHLVGLFVVVWWVWYFHKTEQDRFYENWKDEALDLLKFDPQIKRDDLLKVPYTPDNRQANGDFDTVGNFNVTKGSKAALIKYCKAMECNIPDRYALKVLGMVIIIVIAATFLYCLIYWQNIRKPRFVSPIE